MELSKKLLNKIAYMSRIFLTERELVVFTPQLQTVLESVNLLKKIDTTDIKLRPKLKFADLREDTPQESQPTESLLKNAPKSEGSFIRIDCSTFAEE